MEWSKGRHESVGKQLLDAGPEGFRITSPNAVAELRRR
jgi:hypothetical protein